MTREEAANMIKDDIRLHHDSLSGKYRHALRMAVEALSQEAEPTSWSCDGEFVRNPPRGGSSMQND